MLGASVVAGVVGDDHFGDRVRSLRMTATPAEPERMSDVWLNGEFVERDEARVSAFDAGLQHGVGLFETMLGGVKRRGGVVPSSSTRTWLA